MWQLIHITCSKLIIKHIQLCNQYMLGDASKLKISIIMTLSLGPPPPLLASWQK